MIIQTLIQLKGESEPRQHFALVFDDAMGPEDLIVYRNAATHAVKAILSSQDFEPFMADECFWLTQFAEFISSSLDLELQKKGGIV